MIASLKSKRETIMSGRNCIRKTNDEIFGGLWRVIVAALTTSKGLRGLAFGIVVLAIVAGIVVGGISLGAAHAQSSGSGFVFACIMGTTMLTAIMSVIYLITLYENCKPSDVESE